MPLQKGQNFSKGGRAAGHTSGNKDTDGTNTPRGDQSSHSYGQPRGSRSTTRPRKAELYSLLHQGTLQRNP
ncbi:hypothetical protein ISCGN_016326 [Ixodes scapularis]